MYSRTCPKCKCDFETVDKRQIYCSKECYHASIRKYNEFIKKDGYYEIVLKSPTYGEKVALIDEQDYDLVKDINWNFRLDGNVYYAYGFKDHKSIMLHRYILNAKPYEVVDHKDRNGLNNRRNNIWICSTQQNACNHKLNTRNSTGYNGVSFDTKKQKYKVSLQRGYKYYGGGYFDNLDEAIAKRKQLEKELFFKSDVSRGSKALSDKEILKQVVACLNLLCDKQFDKNNAFDILNDYVSKIITLRDFVVINGEIK